MLMVKEYASKMSFSLPASLPYYSFVNMERKREFKLGEAIKRQRYLSLRLLLHLHYQLFILR